MRPVGTRLAFATLLGLSVAAVIGCASTRVEKNPGPHDRGVRYYRPKPYLLIAPADGDTKKVKVSLDYLPDFSEEYSIHVRAGIGTNKTSIGLANGWRLDTLNIEVDSKASEMVTAVGGLIANLAKAPAGGAPPGNTNTEIRGATCIANAYNVPLGYYESVVSTAPDGKRQLYGWRYVGFMPFAQCPTQMTGGQCQNCTEADLFGLVTISDTLYFRRLNEMHTSPQQVTVEVKPAEVKPPPTPPKVDPKPKG